jgi:hypothetical protein
MDSSREILIGLDDLFIILLSIILSAKYFEQNLRMEDDMGKARRNNFKEEILVYILVENLKQMTNKNIQA